MTVHKSTPDEKLYIRSMGKSLRIIAIATSDDEANAFMEHNDGAAVIACFGPFVLMADKYDRGMTS